MQMLQITQEMRHFESIFLEPTDDPYCFRTRVFDLVEELPFAGHPLVGAAATLHRQVGSVPEARWKFLLGRRKVEVSTRCFGPNSYSGLMDQGRPVIGSLVDDRHEIAASFRLEPQDLAEALPIQVISTGLRYLVVPVRQEALARASIARDISPLVAKSGAEYAVILSENLDEIRHWTNDGSLEDSATGSAAGTIAAYALHHGLVEAGKFFRLSQGRFVGRPSTLNLRPTGSAGAVEKVEIEGHVAFVGSGELEVIP